MDLETILLFCFLAFIAEVVGTVGGFGSSVFFVPLATFFFDFKIALALTGVLHVFSNISKMFLFRSHINLKLFLNMGVPSIIFVIIGAYLTSYIKIEYGEIILGSFLFLFSLVMLLKPKMRVSPTVFNAITGGSIAGFLAGFIGTGGVVRGLLLSAYGLYKNTFIATSAAIDMGVDLSRMLIYLDLGYMQKNLYLLVPILLVIAIAGSYIGKQIVNKISQENFSRIVLIFIAAIGVFTLIKNII